MNVYGISIPIKSLTNIELQDYVRQLQIPNFRGTFMRDALPSKSNKVECGILNLDDESGKGTHWTCWYRDGKNRMYFDSYGLITPIEMQTYLKTKREFDNNTQVIQRNTDEVQPRGTSICGHLCLYVLKSLSDGSQFQDVVFSIKVV